MARSDEEPMRTTRHNFPTGSDGATVGVRAGIIIGIIIVRCAP
ncbi:MAG: hypothetical protein ACP5HU_08545 [Phycisphaerae bacterium]